MYVVAFDSKVTFNNMWTFYYVDFILVKLEQYLFRYSVLFTKFHWSTGYLRVPEDVKSFFQEEESSKYTA